MWDEIWQLDVWWFSGMYISFMQTYILINLSQQIHDLKINNKINFDFLLIWQLDLQLQDEMGGDLSSFVTNGEWELLGEYRIPNSVFVQFKIIYNNLHECNRFVCLFVIGVPAKRNQIYYNCCPEPYIDITV